MGEGVALADWSLNGRFGEGSFTYSTRVEISDFDRQRIQSQFANAVRDLDRGKPVKQKDTDLMRTTIDTVKTKAGHVGQVLNAETADIIWESSPFAKDEVNADGKVVKTTYDQAIAAAKAKVNEVVAGLFA